MRNPDGVFVLHRPDHRFIAEDLVAFDIDLADLYLGTLINLEDDLQRRGRDTMNLWIHLRVLASPFGQIFQDDVLGALHLVRVVLRFHYQTDLALFETIENFRDGERLIAVVFDGPDHGPFGDNIA